MPERTGPGWSWAIFFARWVLGLICFMAGWWKVFELTPAGHVERYFTGQFADTWIPTWLLWAIGATIPLAELLAGGLLCLGLRVREALVALGGVLVIVTYGHLLLEPLFSTSGHIFPRLVLLLFLLVAPRGDDRLSLDAWLARRAG
jgi:putative oxidoreductase